MPGDFSIGSKVWPGISKLIEEVGEVQQVAGKLIATGGEVAHWDGTNLRDRLEEEMADLMAAVGFIITTNGFNAEKMYKRTEEKLTLFVKWHQAGNPTPAHHSPRFVDGRAECSCGLKFGDDDSALILHVASAEVPV